MKYNKEQILNGSAWWYSLIYTLLFYRFLLTIPTGNHAKEKSVCIITLFITKNRLWGVNWGLKSLNILKLFPLFRRQLDCLQHLHTSIQAPGMVFCTQNSSHKTVSSLLKVLMISIWSDTANTRQAITVEPIWKADCLLSRSLYGHSNSRQRLYWIWCTWAHHSDQQQWYRHRSVQWREHFHGNQGSSRWCCSLYTRCCIRHIPSELHSTLQRHAEHLSQAQLHNVHFYVL